MSRQRSTCLCCGNAIWRDSDDQKWQSFADRGATCKTAPKVEGKPGLHIPQAKP